MLIYFLRHASAGESLDDPKKDEKRPLDDDGISQCREVGRALAAMDVHVDVILSSPLKRASQTASMVANEIGHERKLQFADALRPGADFSGFRDLLQKYGGQDAIMVVGHNPNLSDFLGRVVGSTHQPARIELKKGAVARVDWSKRGTLDWCLTPKVVRAIS